MPGYSGTPLPQKLGVKPGHTVVLIHSTPDLAEVFHPLPEPLDLHQDLPPAGRCDVILFFTSERAELEERFSELAARLTPAGGLWICWPKRASGVPTDLNENVIRELGLGKGLVDNKVCAVTDIWSGLRFVYRLVDRARLPTN